MSLDINFEVSVIPGPPASWSVAVVDYRKGAAAAAAAAAGKAGEADGAADLTSIPCGQPFYLEIEALDACHNRWGQAARHRDVGRYVLVKQAMCINYPCIVSSVCLCTVEEFGAQCGVDST